MHYTPAELADFLAGRLLLHAHGERLEVLDPACGDGGLLAAAVRAGCGRVSAVTGIDRDPVAVSAAAAGLAATGCEVRTQIGDFLAAEGPIGLYDAVISNPPYVRAQVLGSAEAQRLGRRFGLRGRIDLSHAFVVRMAEHLAPGGVLGLICSNRFLVTRGGASLREFLAREFEVLELFDLGDTRLFAAAVLPAVLIARRSAEAAHAEPGAPPYVRIYSTAGRPVRSSPTVVSAIASGAGAVRVGDVTYQVESGTLDRTRYEAWSLRSPDQAHILDAIAARTERRLGDYGKVRVGVKTTADAVFIRSDWDDLPHDERPEDELLHPLLSHAAIHAWRVGPPTARILYPYDMAADRRTPVDLARYPRAARYLERHRGRLEGRAYLQKSGRAWYEIWVAQRPRLWRDDKLVVPDIADRPRFALDTSGSIVNGDCYWMRLDETLSATDRALLLAVANSSLAMRFYDLVCGNRLYSGRRRFVTQYVERFPVPRVSAGEANALRRLAGQLQDDPADADAARDLDARVWAAFGLEQG